MQTIKKHTRRNVVSIVDKYEAIMNILSKKMTRNQVCLSLKIAQSTSVQWINISRYQQTTPFIE